MGNRNWKPIKTAPKDGREVLLFLPFIENEQEERWVKAHWYKFFDCWSNEYNNGPGYNDTWVINKHPNRMGHCKTTRIKPSHWMDISPP